MYGSSLTSETLILRDSRIAAREAAAMPLPREETTPPVTKTYLVMTDPRDGNSYFTGIGWIRGGPFRLLCVAGHARGGSSRPVGCSVDQGSETSRFGRGAKYNHLPASREEPPRAGLF